MSSPTEPLVFGPFRLEVARRELTAHGVPVTLGQRAFDVLLALVSRQGQLVTKDELMAEVWPGIVVEENNLQVHVSALRKVLGAAGVGKTRLSIEAGISLLDNYSDGVWLAELAPLDDAQLVTAIIGDVLGVSLAGPAAAVETLASALKSKHLLLIIDNCEHVVA